MKRTRTWGIMAALAMALAATPAALAQTSRSPTPSSPPQTVSAGQTASPGDGSNTQVTRVMYGDVKRLNLTPEQRSWVRAPGAEPVVEPKTLVQVLNKYPNITAEDWRSFAKEMEQNGGRIVILRF